jgi:hypothetical protein
MTTNLTKRQEELIEYLCTLGDGVNAELCKRAKAGQLSHEDVGKLCEIISDELMLKGIEKSFEPNDYGLELENLLDDVNRERLHR